MEDCIACGTKLPDGVTKCPECGVNLTRKGMGILIMGWIAVGISLIPLVVGIIAAQQRSYIPLVFGGMMLLSGFFLVTLGSVKVSSTPLTTRPSAKPETTLVQSQKPHLKI